MPYRIKITGIMPAKAGKYLGDLSKAEHELAQYAKELADPYVPARTGALARSTRVSGNVVSYDAPQAHALYMGKRVPRRTSGGYKIVPMEISQAVHLRAQTFWFWGAKKDNMVALRQKATELLKKELKIR